MRPMRADVGRLLERIERAAPAGDSHITIGQGDAGTHEPEHGKAH
jgi:NADH-quinone oxidoreductase subunit M